MEATEYIVGTRFIQKGDIQMSKVESFMTDKVMPVVTKFSNFKFIRAMTSGIVAPTAATIVGSIIAVLQTPPFPAGTGGAFVEVWRAWSAANGSWLSLVYAMTLNAVALYTLFGVSLATAQIENKRPTTAICTSFMMFMILCCNYDGQTASVTTSFFGSAGLFTAILIGYLGSEVVFFFEDHGFKIKLPDSVPPNIADAIGSMLYVVIIAAGTVALRLLVGMSGMLLPAIINMCFAPLFSASDSLAAVIIYCLFTRLLWFFGLHGNNIAGSVVGAFLLMATTANTEAYAAGEAMPYIFNGQFQMWCTMGMLPIALSLLLFGKSKQLKAVGKLSLVPSLFAIGEPLTFGLPLVLNFDILLPYLGIFVLDGAVPYILTQMGLIGRAFVTVPWTLPHILKAFLITMDWRASVVYVILLVVNILIMMPSIKKYDKKLLAEELEADQENMDTAAN